MASRMGASCPDLRHDASDVHDHGRHGRHGHGKRRPSRRHSQPSGSVDSLSELPSDAARQASTRKLKNVYNLALVELEAEQAKSATLAARLQDALRLNSKLEGKVSDHSHKILHMLHLLEQAAAAMEDMRSKVRQLTQALNEQDTPDSGHMRRTSSIVLDDGQPGGAQGAANGDARTLPPEYFCPITYDLMAEPVVAADGFSYEHDAIKQWLASNTTSPMTGASLTSTLLVQNKVLKTMIDEATGGGGAAASPPRPPGRGAGAAGSGSGSGTDEDGIETLHLGQAPESRGGTIAIARRRSSACHTVLLC